MTYQTKVEGKTKAEAEQICNPSSPAGPPPPGVGTPPPGTETPPPPAPQCLSIKVYKGTQIVVPATLQVGDQVEIAVAGGVATKARVRINGGSWTETTTKNTAGEFTVDWTVPANTTNVSMEAEIFVNGAWL